MDISDNNKERSPKRRQSDTLWGQIKSELLAKAIFTAVSGAIVIAVGFKAVEVKVSNLEITLVNQKKLIEDLQRDVGELKGYVIEIRTDMKNLKEKRIEDKADLNDRLKELREAIRNR